MLCLFFFLFFVLNFQTLAIQNTRSTHKLVVTNKDLTAAVPLDPKLLQGIVYFCSLSVFWSMRHQVLEAFPFVASDLAARKTAHRYQHFF